MSTLSSDVDNSAKNKLIAAALGMEIQDVPFVPKDIKLDRYFTEAACKRLYATYPNAAAVRKLPDFYADEAASAMLLEAMPEPSLWVELWHNEPKKWGCTVDMSNDTIEVIHTDRKSAIADAFVAWKQKEQQ